MTRSTLTRLSVIVLAFLLSGPLAAGEPGAGQAAPNCQLNALNGDLPVSLKDFRGQVVYLDFWASWCTACAQSFPHMNKMHKDLEARGLKVIAINLDENPEDAKAFLAHHPAQFSVAGDAAGRCAQEFGVKAMPSSYLIDRNGVIREVHLGFRPGEAEKFRSQVERLVGESVHANNEVAGLP